MMWKWLEKTKSIKGDLLNFKDEPLSGLSIVLLIILDIFIFTNVMIGVESETNKAPKVYQYYPNDCAKHFKKSQSEYQDFDTYRYSHAKAAHLRAELSQFCQDLELKVQVFTLSEPFKDNLKLIRDIQAKLRHNQNRLQEIGSQYNTRLFERIAQMQNNNEMKNAKKEYDSLIQDNKSLNEELKLIPSVRSLKGYDAYAQFIKDNRTGFKEAKASYTFWQPFKAYGYMLLFILPLLLFFAFFYLRAKAKQLAGKNYNPVVKIISAHISLILILPLFAYTLGLIYHVLPKTLLKNIIEFLVSIGLVSLLNYVAILLVVLIFGGLIYWIQKRAVRQKSSNTSLKVLSRRVALSQCFHCGLKVDYTKPYCPFCAQGLHKKCLSCEATMNEPEAYCSTCGKADRSMPIDGSE